MPNRKVLTHEDDLFGRVALFNNLVTLEQIIESARVIAAEEVAGRPRRSLARVLIEHGYLSSSQAGAVEAALRKRAGEAGKATVKAGATPKPEPLSERADSGSSQINVAIQQASETDHLIDKKKILKFIHDICPGRIYPEMLDYIVNHRISVIDLHQLAAAIHEPEKEVKKALKRWSKARLLKTIGTHPYNFSHSDELEKEIREFLKLWHDPCTHSRILGWILEAE